ncbi:GNAT family N-acetyltransferase [Roseomonas rosulenta]|uniref:GNAT family N-acetyltransferase n=1 Tax=Roseomonas rosulenta TaxID=2748667 RepID=UPI0018E04AD3
MERLAITEHALPAACEPFLAPPGIGDVFSGRAWLETTLRHALPARAQPEFLLAGQGVLLPLLRTGRRMASLTTPYSLDWRPLALHGAGPDALHAAGRELGAQLRLCPPTRIEALDPDDPATAALLDGLRAAGLVLLRFDHFGLWQEVLPPGLGWAAYLASRPPALRNTIARRLARAAGRLDFTLLDRPGPALEDGIAAFAAVRARSWKPDEPFPEFDGALMRALAQTGELRLGVLRAGSVPVAAQYWIVSGGWACVPKLFHAEEARADSPGTVLTALMIRHLLETDRVGTLDFGRGDDAYKRQWVGARRQRIGVLALDPRHPEGLAALLRHAAGHLRRGLSGDGMAR